MFDLAEILTRGSLPIRQTQSLKTTKKFTILVQMEHQFTAVEPKILLKTKHSGKTTSLGISKNVSGRSQKNHIILVKWSKSNYFFGPKLILNCPLGPYQRVTRNSHIGYNKAIHLYFLDAKFLVRGICYSQLYQEETTFFHNDVFLRRIFKSPKVLSFWSSFDLQFTTWRWAKSKIVIRLSK